MKSKLFLLIILLAAFGCEYDLDGDSHDDDGDNTGENFEWPNGFPGSPQTTTPTQPSDSSNTGSGDQTFLWKPVSENNGKLVVLVPARLSTDPIGTLTINDSVRGRFSSIANGNRAHYRFDQPGSAYGQNIPVVLMKQGTRYEWIVPNGASRYSKR